MNEIRPSTTALIAALPATTPFVGPEAQERARRAPFAARLGANENGFGPGPAARAAMVAAAGETWMYGDPEAFELRSAIAAAHDVPIDAVVVGEGIDGLLGVVCRLFLAPGDAAVTSLGAYPTFNYHVAACGGRLETVRYAGDAEDFDALAARADQVGAQLLYVSNPDNPMGSWRSAAEVSRLMRSTPPKTLLLLDEAYLECAPDGVAPAIDVSTPNVLRFRTFSKVFGLAGLRVGYAIGAPELIRAFDKIRNHFGVGRVAQAAALAAFGDAEHLARARADIAGARDTIADIASRAGLTPTPSGANFVAIDCGADGTFAARVMEGLLRAGVFVRKPTVPGLDRCIRVSCGPAAEMAAFARALPVALAAAQEAA